MKADVAIKVDGVSKSFILPHEKSGSIKNALLSIFSKKRGYEVQHVLQDISFEIKKGEFFGIVGRNGSGKSTLLKLLAGIYTPDKGDIKINGSLTPFIELGVGFSPDLSGRENVFLNGALLGFSREEMASMYDDIVDFAELERFMDQKLKNYSSGMLVRLAFSIAIRARSNILLLDEVLAVGDARFQQKCFDYFYNLKKSGQTIVFISHDMSAVEKFCNRAILIEKGHITSIGEPREIATAYLTQLYDETEERPTKKMRVKEPEGDTIKGAAMKKFKKNTYSVNESVEFVFSFELLKQANLELRAVIIKEGVGIADINSKMLDLNLEAGTHVVRLSLSLDRFLEGAHKINWGIYDLKSGHQFVYSAPEYTFYVRKKDAYCGGFFKAEGKWVLDK